MITRLDLGLPPVKIRGLVRPVEATPRCPPLFRGVDTIVPKARFDSMSRMHPLFAKANGLTGQIIGAAIEVHKDKGPGLVESIYEWCLVCELDLQRLATQTQRIVPIRYKDFYREDPLRFDVLVEDCVLVEAKSVERILPIHQAQLLSYMKLLNVPVGLLINFNVMRLSEGVIRLNLPNV